MDKLLNLIGLATNGGMTQAGAFLTEKAVKSGTAELVVVACDTSERSTHDMEQMCQYYNVACIRYGTQLELGQFTGKQSRSVVAVTDPGLAKAILKRFDENKAE